MSTKNQKIVAHSLYLARTVNFATGLEFLQKNMPGDISADSAVSWFAYKCRDHKINTPIFPLEREE
jgi:hypothetical protein